MSTTQQNPATENEPKLIELLAENAADAARYVQENRDILRGDPEFTDARYWLSEARGVRRALAEAIVELRRRLSTGRFDAVEYAEWLYRRHKSSNERRSTQTGLAERSAKGYHHGTYVALKAVREATGIEYEDYGDDVETVSENDGEGDR